MINSSIFIFMKYYFINFYNNLVKLTRNKALYKHFNKKDEFSDRLIFLLIHLSFFFKHYKSKKNAVLLQEIYDFIFRQLELSIREIGYGDQSINKKMKEYLNSFHAVLNKVHFWDKYSDKDKTKIFDDLIENSEKNIHLVRYFDEFSANLLKYNLNSYLKSVSNQ